MKHIAVFCVIATALSMFVSIPRVAAGTNRGDTGSISGHEKIAKNIRYPEMALKCAVQGKVFIEATLNRAGEVLAAKVIRGIGFGCDEEALQAVKRTKFSVSEIKSSGDSFKLLIPVNFKLHSKRNES